MSNTQFTSAHIGMICITSLIAGMGFIGLMTFLYMADTLSQLFFFSQDKDWSYYLQLAGLFIISCVAMPLGGVMVGKYGDKYGRQTALMVSLFGMGLFTLLLGLLPTLLHISTIASSLFMLAKFGQSMAFGGLIPTVWVFATEHLPKKNIGFGLGVITASWLLALLVLSGVIFGLESHLTSHQLLNYGWRVPFLFSGIGCFVLLIFVYHMDETPIFEEYQEQKAHHTPTKALSIHTFTQDDEEAGDDSHTRLMILHLFIKKHLAVFLPALTLSWLVASLFVITTLLLPNLINVGFVVPENLLRLGSIISITFMMMGCVVFGAMSDYINASKLMSVGGVLFIVQILLFFGHLKTGGELILVFFALLGFFGGVIATVPPILVRLFAVKHRLTYTSLIYNISYALASSALPFLLGYATFYVRLAPALYLALVVATTVFISFYVYHIPTTDHHDGE